MKHLKLILSLCLMILFTSSITFSADITSAQSGPWASTSTWVGNVVPTSGDNVTIATSHTVEIVTSGVVCYNLTIESGAKLWGNAARTTSKFLRVYGTTVTVNGTYGGDNDALGLSLYGASPQTVTITGAGTFKANRIQQLVSGNTLIFNMDAEVHYAGTGGTGGTGLYIQTAGWSFTVQINAEKTLTMGTSSYLSAHSSSSTTAGIGNLTVNVNGTLTTSSSAHINLNQVSSTSTLNVYNGGTVNLGANLNASTVGTGSIAINVSNGGTLNALSGSTFNCSAAIVSAGGAINNNANAATIGTINFSGSGKITLGANNLTATTITGNSSTSYVVTGGAGSLVRNVGASDVTFPVGLATSYNPVIINNIGTADNFSVRVKSTFDNAPVDPNNVVNREWTIDEEVAGGSDATLTFQWNSADEASGFDRSAGIEIGRWTSQWVGHAAVYNGGSDPYSTYVGNITSFSNFAVGNSGALPVQLASFVGNVVGNNAQLEWQTISEINNYGFNVQRYDAISKSYNNVGFVAGKGVPSTYTYLEENISGSLEYRLEQIDNNGLTSYFGPIMLNPNSVGSDAVPAVFALNQNYPNPFNPSTIINYQLAIDNYTTLKVYNLIGKEVATLANGNQSAGSHQVTFDGSALTSGVYFYKLQSGSSVEVKKLTLVK